VGAQFDERCDLLAIAIPDRGRNAAGEQGSGERGSHQSESRDGDLPDLLRLLHETLPSTFMRTVLRALAVATLASVQ
jgi:hypothetical protein